MRAKMGSAAVDNFAKLYLFPGVAHCGGGEGPNTFDILTPVMAWVESGRQPGRIVASNAVNAPVARTRPVYPYPAVARYGGSGSTDDAANFVAFTPAKPVRDNNEWIGQGLYSHGYQTWPQAVDGKRVLRRG